MAPSGYVDPLNARMASRWALGFDILPLIGVAIGHVPPGLAIAISFAQEPDLRLDDPGVDTYEEVIRESQTTRRANLIRRMHKHQ